jgi:hypothetical protein
MKFLPMVGFDQQAGANILVDEFVIENGDIGEDPIPGAVLEDRRGGTARTIKNDVRRIVRTQPMPFDDRQRAAVCE